MAVELLYCGVRNGRHAAVEALRSATIDGAKFIGIYQDLGSIEVGYLADKIIPYANLLDIIRKHADD